MPKTKEVEIFGEIAVQLVVAMSMHAENMQRQVLGLSAAYTEEQFGVVIDTIEKLTESSKETPKTKKFQSRSLVAL